MSVASFKVLSALPFLFSPVRRGNSLILTYSSASTDAGQSGTETSFHRDLFHDVKLVAIAQYSQDFGVCSSARRNCAVWPAFVLMLPLPVLLPWSVDICGMHNACNTTNSRVLAPSSSVLTAMPSWDRPLRCSRQMRSHRRNAAVAGRRTRPSCPLH